MIILTLVLVFLIIRFCVTLFNFISNPKLTFSSKRYHELVSILIPARNEEQRIMPLLHSIVDQDYENYEVIILDDNSTDRTFELINSFAAEHPNFRILKGLPLGDGWQGKNYACHQLADEAKGNYFLFVDADVELRDGAIRSTVNRMKVFKLAVLSLFADQKIMSKSERLVVPLINYLLLSLLPLRLVSLTKMQAFVAASGQFMFFDARYYRRFSWHQKVRSEVAAEVEIMKEVKASGLKVEALLANSFITSEIYTSYIEGIEGLSRILLAKFSYSFFGVFAYLFLIVFGYSSLVMIPNVFLISLALFMIIGIRIMISMLSGQNVLKNVLLHPFQLITLVIVGVVAVQKNLTRTVKWKGRKILNNRNGEI